jgi:hypothetical protein
MKTVLITGGRGLIGQNLARQLLRKGYKVIILSRNNKPLPGLEVISWRTDNRTSLSGVIRGADYIIHLAGADIISKKWTAARKQEIVDSRVESAQFILEILNEQDHACKGFISASAVGYYGTSASTSTFTESDVPAADFIGNTCKLWEAAADRFEGQGIRTVKLRMGVVLVNGGRVLDQPALATKMWLGSAIGSGNQPFPFIHIDDLCSIYIRAIEDEGMAGAFNAVAPNQVSNKEFARTLAQVLGKPLWLPNIPTPLVKLFLGERSGLVLNGNRVSPARIMSQGYDFQFPELQQALHALLVDTR